jgi:hypothetical protein
VRIYAENIGEKNFIMTIVFSIAFQDLIIMTADSCVTEYSENSVTTNFTIGRKAYNYPGVGCVTTWGARDQNLIGRYLETKRISPDNHSVEDLANIVNEYLTKEFRPDELNTDMVGYHVSGFTKEGKPKLFHIFWDYDRPLRLEQKYPEYKFQDHSPSPGKVVYLYNGRNDVVEYALHDNLYKIKTGEKTDYLFRTLDNIVSFSDYAVRLGANITPEVGPPFITYLISPKNETVMIRNDNKLSSINPDIVIGGLRKLGYKVINQRNKEEVEFSVLLEQIEQCLRQRLYYVAIMASLAIPDIGGAIDSDDGNSSQKNYADWFNKYVKPRYIGELDLTGDECYYLRCSMLHQGKAKHKKIKVVFMHFPQSDAPVNPLLLDNDQGLLVEPRTFCYNMIYAAYAWLEIVYNDDRFKKNMKNFMTLYSLYFSVR